MYVILFAVPPSRLGIASWVPRKWARVGLVLGLGEGERGKGRLAPPDPGKAGVINKWRFFFDRRYFATRTR